MELIVRTLLLAGAFINMCAIACLLGIAYIIPMAYPGVHADEFSVLLVGGLIVASTLLAWLFFRRDSELVAVICMYAWWIAGVWFINRLILGT